MSELLAICSGMSALTFSSNPRREWLSKKTCVRRSAPKCALFQPWRMLAPDYEVIAELIRSLRAKTFKAETSQPRRAHLTRVLSLRVHQTTCRAARFTLSADSLGVVHRELMSRVV